MLRKTFLKLLLSTPLFAKALTAKAAEPDKQINEIFILKCHIAGTSYVTNIDSLEPEIGTDDTVILKREPDNPADELAILVLDKYYRKLGYIPRIFNPVLARLMDAGKSAYGLITHKNYWNNWLKIDIDVYFIDGNDNKPLIKQNYKQVMAEPIR